MAAASLVAVWFALPSDAVRAESAAVPAVIIHGVKVTEGDSGTTRFTADVYLSWSTPLEVEINAVPGTASRDDFAFEPVRLTLVPGAAAVVISGAVVGDLAPEGDESFSLVATRVDAGGFPGFVLSQWGTIEIVDDDLAPGLHVEGATVLEGNQGTTTVEARVRLEPAGASPVTVNYQTEDGTATTLAGDFKVANGTLTFAPGEVLKTIALEIPADTVWEPEKYFSVVLSAARGAALVTARAKIVIADDDPASVVTLDDASVVEGNLPTKEVALTLRFDRPVPETPKVHVWVRAGSARAGEDFVPQVKTVLYPLTGATTVQLVVTIVGDARPECDEGILIDYRGIYTGDDTPRTARLLIQDDDGGPADPTTCPDPFVPAPQGLPVDSGTAPPTPVTNPDAGAPVDLAIESPAAIGQGGDGGAMASPPLSPRPRADGCAIGGPSHRGTGEPLAVGVSLLAFSVLSRRGRRKPR